jgi:hypothetical protein
MTLGTLELGLLSAEGAGAADDQVEVRFKRDGTAVEPVRGISLKKPMRFDLPAFPEVSVWQADVLPKRFRARSAGFFTVTHGETVRRRLTVLRSPSQWNARFAKWKSLGAGFEDFQRLMERSPELTLREGNRPLGTFAGPRYDDVDDQRLILGKTSLLNLRAKLAAEPSPVSGRPWFDGVRQVLSFGRERMIALVEPWLAEEVGAVHGKPVEGYKRTNAKNHRKNIPGEFSINRMFSIKSGDRKGNLQLTIALARDAAGASVAVADFDIDENGAALKHLLDLFKHKVTGGTHPYDVHEILRLTDADAELGYTLV